MAILYSTLQQTNYSKLHGFRYGLKCSGRECWKEMESNNRPLDWEFTSFRGSCYGTWETKYHSQNKGLLHKLIWHRVCLYSFESGFMFIERQFGCRYQGPILCDRDLQKGRRGFILPILLLIRQDMFIRQEL